MPDKVKLNLTFWDRQNLYELLSSQNIARAPLGKVQDMMEARANIDPSELKTDGDSKSYTLTFSKPQFDHIYKIATNENIPWPINENSAKLFEKLNEAKDEVNEGE